MSTPPSPGSRKAGKRAALAATMAGVAGLALAVGSAAPAAACGGLVAPNGTVRLLRTTTLAGWHDGVEHYITSFRFAGDAQGQFGSIVPLPGVPTRVERAGDWTLQRLERETAPRFATAAGGAAATSAARESVEVLQQVRIDALDLTVLKGGGRAVGDWAREHGFLLTPDAPEILDFYAHRSPVFLAARFDAASARARGQLAGDGTPVHVTIPLDNPWVPLRILTLGRGAQEPINADVYLLTDDRPSVLPAPDEGIRLAHSAAASASLLRDLRSDKGMSWVPDSSWLTLLRIDTPSERLHHDLAVDVHGNAPAPELAGTDAPIHEGGGRGWIPLGVAAAAVAVFGAAVVVAGARRSA